VSRYRLRRGPVVGLVLIVGLVGAYVIARGSLRPQLEVLAPVTVPGAYEGTTYAFDGLVCLRAGGVPVEVTGVDQADGGPVRTHLLRRPPGAPTVAFPVAAGAGLPVAGLRVPAGREPCLRVLATADGQGDQRAGQVTLHARYGPFGLLRAALEVRPPVLLQVTGTGRDPRADA